MRGEELPILPVAAGSDHEAHHDLTRPEKLQGVKALGRGLLRSGDKAPPARGLHWFLVNATSLYAKRPATG